MGYKMIEKNYVYITKLTFFKLGGDSNPQLKRIKSGNKELYAQRIGTIDKMPPRSKHGQV